MEDDNILARFARNEILWVVRRRSMRTCPNTEREPYEWRVLSVEQLKRHLIDVLPYIYDDLILPAEIAGEPSGLS